MASYETSIFKSIQKINATLAFPFGDWKHAARLGVNQGSRLNRQDL